MFPHPDMKPWRKTLRKESRGIKRGKHKPWPREPRIPEDAVEAIHVSHTGITLDRGGRG